MNLISFMEQFHDEKCCKLKIKLMRGEAVVICRHC